VSAWIPLSFFDCYSNLQSEDNLGTLSQTVLSRQVSSLDRCSLIQGASLH
jgi:hypothetical protein